MATPEVIMADAPVAQRVMPSVESQQPSTIAVQSEHPRVASHSTPLPGGVEQRVGSMPANATQAAARQATNTPKQPQTPPPITNPKTSTPAPGVAPLPVLGQQAVNGHVPSPMQLSKFASPEAPRPPAGSNTSNQYAEVSTAITKARPGVVRHVIRDNWNRCLMGSEYHIAFVVSGLLPAVHMNTRD
jgi:hypothetical protein